MSSLIAILALLAPGLVHADSRGSNAGQAFNMEVVGHNNLDGRGFNADVWVHEGYVYVGQWGFGDWASGAKDRFCPTGSSTSVLIIDARNPANPQIVGRLQNPASTSIEDVVVYTAQTGPLAGHVIAAGGIQYCGDSLYDAKADRGLMLWDVTNPASPSQVLASGLDTPSRSIRATLRQAQDSARPAISITSETCSPRSSESRAFPYSRPGR